MVKKLFAPILFSVLLLSSCNLTLPNFGPTSSVTNTDTNSSTDTSSSSTSTNTNPTSTGPTTTTTTTTSSTTPTVTSVTVSPSSVNVQQGSSYTFSATVNGTNNPSQAVTWSTSNSNVATISSSGVATVKANAVIGATVTITARSSANTIKYGTATLRVTAAPATVTSVTVSPTSASVKPGKTTTLSATVTGTNSPAQTVTWSSLNTSVATVSSSGVVTVKSTATAGQTATIKATSTVDTAKSGTATITVATDTGKAAYTVLLYLCGSTLEYGQNQYTGQYQVFGAATDDLQEILNVSNQPDDVNIVVETGGSKKWDSSLGINASYLQRYEVRNKSLSSPINVTKANMGASNTLKEFLIWGFDNYPADKYALILWDHGGAVGGVCCDDNYSMDSLTTSEVASALSAAFSATGVSKLEWIGYDACIMNYADNVAVMSDYANYYVCSQELENGDGWDYEGWVPTLYSNPTGSTVTLLDKICSSFVTQYGSGSSNDQHLSAIDLNAAKTFVTEFDSYTSHFTTSSHFNTIKTCMSNVNSKLRFGEDCYGIVDMKAWLTKMSSSFSSYSITSLTNAISSMVVSNKYGGYYSSSNIPCGTNVFIAVSLDSEYPLQCSKSEYTTSDTKFQTWRTLNITYGTDWYS